jgi:hypothetical protein
MCWRIIIANDAIKHTARCFEKLPEAQFKNTLKQFHLEQLETRDLIKFPNQDL